MIELTLLKALSIKESFNKYKNILNPKTLSQQSLLLLKDYEVYFHKYEHDKIDWNLFPTYFFEIRHPYLDEKSILEYKTIIESISSLAVNGEIKEIYKGFEQQEFYIELQRLLDSNIDIKELKIKLDDFNKRIETKTELDVEMDLKSSLDYTNRSEGLIWRCEKLKNHFQGGLIKGDFGIIAGYVDTGKSSFIASEVSNMGQQLKDDEYILWCSNEGDWKSLLPRLYCSTLNCTDKELRQYLDKAEEKYIRLMNGNKNRIVIKDIQGWSYVDLEDLVISNPPKLLVIDLLDNVNGFNKESEWSRYGKLYQWAREIATQFCPVLGVSQLNGDGENKEYPSMSRLRGSRVDKQGAATFQLHIGALEGNNDIRYLSMPKNKINSNKSWRVQVKFDANRSRFI
jgi:replicative DNA helicase